MHFLLVTVILAGILAKAGCATASCPSPCEHLKTQLQQLDTFVQIFEINAAATKEVMNLVKSNGLGCVHPAITTTDKYIPTQQPLHCREYSNLVDILEETICLGHRFSYMHQDEHMYNMGDDLDWMILVLRLQKDRLDEICPCTSEEGKELMASTTSLMDRADAAIQDFHYIKSFLKDEFSAWEVTRVAKWKSNRGTGD